MTGEKNKENQPAGGSDLIPIELAGITKNRGTVTKEIWLNAEGKIESSSKNCYVKEGIIHRLHYDDWRDFAPDNYLR